MKKFNIRITILLCMITFVAMGMPMVKANAEDVGYAVRAIIPDNQLDKHQTYFDLRMTPDQKQVIKVQIFNSSNKDKEIDVKITNPITNRNGLIDYTQQIAKIDKSLKVPITKIATFEEKTVTVPAKKSITIPIQLQMSKKEFDGIILGGIYFSNHMDKQTEPKQQIINKYGYVIGLKLSETDKVIKPKLHLLSVKPGLVNYHTAVIAKIQNSTPVIVNKLTIKAKVYNSKGKKINQVDVKDYRMAPNTTMPFAIDWKNQKLKPGKYTLKLHAETVKQKWDWKKEFTIQGEKSKKINQKAVGIERNYTWWIVIGFSVVILILIYIIIRLKKKNIS